VVDRGSEGSWTCGVEVNQGLDVDYSLQSLVMMGACLSSRKERVVL